MKTYFVTGATGVVGSALVPLLLEDPDTSTWLLLRADSEAHLRERLEGLLSFWDFDPADTALRARIHAVRGDASLPRFGLPADDFEALSGRCTHIVHCAGQVRMNLPMEDARRAAVDSARNIVQLAQSCQERGNLKKVEFVSTVGVGGRNPGPLPEEWITNEREFHNTYEASKAEAESYIAEQINNGLPVTVHRPSMVVGDSRSGKVMHFQVFYHLCEFLTGRRTLGVSPGLGESRLDTIPVDCVARAIAWSSNEQATSGRILHLCSGPEHAIKLMELQRVVRKVYRDTGEKLPPRLSVPQGLFRAIIPLITWFVPRRTKRALKTLPIFLDYLGEDLAFLNTKTHPLLKTADIEIPDVQSYLDTVLRYYLTHRK